MLKINWSGKIFFLLLCLADKSVVAQRDSGEIKFSGYIETYVNTVFNQRFPNYLTNYASLNSVNINLGLIKGSYEKANFRSNFGLANGTYILANNLPGEGALGYIWEANIGFKLNVKRSIWIDVGVMPSHIGFESAIGKDNFALTRSVFADNSPYYETGIRMSFISKNEKLYAAAFVLNGWQNIKKYGNDLPALGHQITYKPNKKWTLNSSGFYGYTSNYLGSVERYFHNFYAMGKIGDKMEVVLGLDAALQPNSKYYFAPALLCKYNLSSNKSLALRTEYFQDRSKLILLGNNAQDVYSHSLNFDWRINNHVVWRTEFRQFYAGFDFQHRSINMLSTAICAGF